MRRVALSLVLVPLLVVVAWAERPVPSHSSTTPTAVATVRDVARVNGVAVTSDRLSAALANLIPQESFHRNVSVDRMAEFRQQALSSVIDEELEYQDGVRRGISASDADLKAAWTATVARNGGERAFGNSMRHAGTSEALVRRELARRIVVEKTVNRAVLEHCAVTRDEAQRFFAEHPERFVEPEQLHVFGITVGVDPASPPATWQEAKRRAVEARAALDAGVSFAAVAGAHSTDPSRATGGDMGFVHRGGLASPFDEAVGTLQVGTPSDVIESIYGYHILVVSEVRQQERKPFNQIGDTLVKDLSAKRCGEQKGAWVAALHGSARIEMVDRAP